LARDHQSKEFRYKRGCRKIIKSPQTRWTHYKPWAANAYVEANEAYGQPAIIPVKTIYKENGVLFKG